MAKRASKESQGRFDNLSGRILDLVLAHRGVGPGPYDADRVDECVAALGSVAATFIRGFEHETSMIADMIHQITYDMYFLDKEFGHDHKETTRGKRKGATK